VTALVAVTTCPRPGGASYLAETLASIGRAVVFDDTERRGARWNMWRVFKAVSHSERVLLFQDDVIAEAGLIGRMLAMAIPADVGLVNFHDFGDDFYWEAPPPGAHRFEAHRFGSMGLCGAQCLLIPGAHARWLAERDPDTCPLPGPHRADYALGWFTSQSPRPFKIVVAPSPVRHIGERSACHDDARQADGIGIPHAGRTMADLLKETSTS